MARRPRSRQIEIFNFSFLDILACTIGLLIFIMVMVFILQSGSPVADTAAIVHRKSDEAQRQKLSADQDSAIASQLEEQLGHIHDSVKPDLRAGRDLAARQAETARAEYQNVLAQLRTAEIELATARSERQRKSDANLQRAESALKEARDRNDTAKADVAQAAGAPVVEQLSFLRSRRGEETAEDYDVLHVDCRATSVAFLTSDADGTVHESESLPLSEVGDKDSVFQQRIAAHTLAQNPLVLLWVRPDGADTYKKVREALPEKCAFGYEPADVLPDTFPAPETLIGATQMHARSRAKREVDLFNFSFLDILACVIGLLIFILTIVVVSGGGSKTAEGAHAVAAADREVQDQRFAATLASEKRNTLESLLSQRALDAVDPDAAARSVQGETQLLHNEADTMLAAQLRAARDLEVMRQEIDRTERAAGVDPAMVAAQAETQQLNQATEHLRAQEAQIRQTKVRTKEVTYYVPRLRETDRFPVWLEIAGNRLYYVESDSYERIPLHEDAVAYRRRPGADGIRIGSGAEFMSAPLSRLEAATIVLSVAVRPDSYDSFRKLRDEAWAKGYSVNWIPMEAEEPIVLVPSHNAFEQ